MQRDQAERNKLERRIGRCSLCAPCRCRRVARHPIRRTRHEGERREAAGTPLESPLPGTPIGVDGRS
eukprot:59009-Prymnesium_polylepis.1